MAKPPSLRKRSRELEQKTGFDSIDTIERVYLTDEFGRYLCCLSGCSYAVGDAEAMWRHIHGLASRSPHRRVFVRKDLEPSK